MEVTPIKKISLPQIKHVGLENFDIYSRQPNIQVEINRGVFCLIGANGLGKSTFLNTLIFVITGAIPDPSRKFQSALEYYRSTSRADRIEDYFSGRITEPSRALAKATVKLTFGEKTLEITRDIFEGSGISCLVITNEVTKATEILSLANGQDSMTLAKSYESLILELTHLNDFTQFVFLLHFVSTFDEGRHLLMWDDGALTNALYLAFGADPVKAQTADKLQHDMEREASRGRNIRFAARHIKDQIDHLIAIIQGSESENHLAQAELQEKHNALINQQTQSELRVRNKQTELRDIDSKWAELSSMLTEHHLEYRKLFSSRLSHTTSVEHHPIIRATLSEDCCAICGTSHISTAIKHKIENKECPLCNSHIESLVEDETAIKVLRDLDEKIIFIRNNLEITLKTRDRVNAELVASEAAENAADEQLKLFEAAYSGSIARAEAGNNLSAVNKRIEELKKEQDELIAKSEDHYRKRDEVRKNLRILEKQLKVQYDLGAEIFVPRFRELAEEFIGLPVDVELEQRQGATTSGFGLMLRMNQQLRISADKLSESQRFFIDIALRMALSEIMSDSQSTLLIDTPEGSLDIAYEARAGAMFSKFVANNNSIIMTANLRSSQLVLRLAELQKEAGMQFSRMTDWTDLSEVQRSEEHLFTRAYDDIFKALI